MICSQLKGHKGSSPFGGGGWSKAGEGETGEGGGALLHSAPLSGAGLPLTGPGGRGSSGPLVLGPPRWRRADPPQAAASGLLGQVPRQGTVTDLLHVLLHLGLGALQQVSLALGGGEGVGWEGEESDVKKSSSWRQNMF